MTNFLNSTALAEASHQASNRLDRVRRKLEEFNELVPGWHYGSGNPLQPDMGLKAELVLAAFEARGIVKADAFLGAEGDVLLVAYEGQFCVEVGLELDETVVAVFKSGKQYLDEEEFGSLALAEPWISERLGRMTGIRWNTYTLYTQNTSIGNGESSRTLPSSAIATGAASWSF